jgi:hypothetical protein
MSRSKKSTDNLPYKEFISVLKKLYRLTSDFQELSIRIRSQIGKQERTPFEQQSLKNDFEKRSHLLEVFAQSGVVIYREAVRLQLPTRPDNVLHLASNWLKSKNDAEIDGIIDKAEAETLQMILEAQALRTKTTGGKATPNGGVLYRILRNVEEQRRWNTLEKLSASLGKQPAGQNSGKAGGTKTVAKKLKKPISDKAAAVYELLKTMPEHRGLTGRKIIEELSKKNIFIDQSTLTKNIIPILKKDYGVKSQPRIGYYIAK